MRKKINNLGFSLTELMASVAFSILLITAVYSFYNASRKSFTAGISGQTLQDAADIILSKIIEGETESGVVYRLSTAVSYLIPDGTPNKLYTCGGVPQVNSCNASSTAPELYFCQDNPCTSNDATARWYYLNSTATAVMYHHPGLVNDETVYVAPVGSSIVLRFTPPLLGTPAVPSSTVVEVDVAVTSNISKNLLATNGSSSTLVLLRNHP